MAKIIEEFFLETGQYEKFEVITFEEEVEVNGKKFTNEHTYWKLLQNGELFAPFDNPDLNLDSDYKIYRELMGLLSPTQVKAIRDNYELSLRDFAKLLGIGYATLSKIENGAIHSSMHDALLRLASDPYAFYTQLLVPKKNLIDKQLYQALSKRIEKLIDLKYQDYGKDAHNFLKEGNKQKKYSNSIERYENRRSVCIQKNELIHP